jgi:hypothetical protein
MLGLRLTNRYIMLDVFLTVLPVVIVSFSFLFLFCLPRSKKKDWLLILLFFFFLPDTGFSDAVTNATSPSDSYIYYLPLGVSFPVSSPSPSCSQCLRDTMAVFSSAASNSSQLISGVYAGAVTVVNAGCGKGFVHVPVASSATRVFGLVVDGGLRRCSAGFVLVVFSFVVAGFM